MNDWNVQIYLKVKIKFIKKWKSNLLKFLNLIRSFNLKKWGLKTAEQNKRIVSNHAIHHLK